MISGKCLSEPEGRLILTDVPGLELRSGNRLDAGLPQLRRGLR
jgi:hypothetical protein